MRYNAMEIKDWCKMNIKGVDGYFCDSRIERNSIPAEYNLYELGDSSSDGTPCRYKYNKDILVDFYGTFISKDMLPIEDDEHDEGYIAPCEYGYEGEYFSLDKVLDIKYQKKINYICDTCAYSSLCAVEEQTKKSIDNIIDAYDEQKSEGTWPTSLIWKPTFVVCSKYRAKLPSYYLNPNITEKKKED